MVFTIDCCRDDYSWHSRLVRCGEQLHDQVRAKIVRKTRLNICSNYFSALSLNADLNLSLVFGLRFAENLAVGVILWFFTDTIVHRVDSSTTSVSSSKGKSKAQLSTVNSKTNASVAGQASVAPANNTLSESDD